MECKSSRDGTAAVIEIIKHGLLIDGSKNMADSNIEILTARRGGVACFEDPAMMLDEKCST